MKKYKDKLKNIEFQIADKASSYITFHFLYFDESTAQLQGNEEDVKVLCRSILTDVYSMIEILCKYKVPEINNYITPQFKYGSTYFKPERRYFEITYSLGKTKPDKNPLELFYLILTLRNVESGMESIEYGHFDLEFQSFRWDKHVSLEVEFNDTSINYFNSKLIHLTMPIKSIIENIMDKQYSKVILSKGEIQEPSHSEGEVALVSEGIIIQLPEQVKNQENNNFRSN